MSRFLLDACCLMEILFAREKSEEIIRLVEERATSQPCISVLTVHILYYFAQKDAIKREIVERLLDSQKILAVDSRTVKTAQGRYDGKDFEDCLQAACAELGGCDEIVTLDKNFKKVSGTRLTVTAV